MPPTRHVQVYFTLHDQVANLNRQKPATGTSKSGQALLIGLTQKSRQSSIAPAVDTAGSDNGHLSQATYIKLSSVVVYMSSPQVQTSTNPALQCPRHQNKSFLKKFHVEILGH
jgi:hypothetical protein